MWYKFSQNIQELDPNKTRQSIPSGGQLEIKLLGADFNMGPDDPPKQIQVQTDSGQQKSIYLLHGTPDGMLVFGDRGNLISGTEDEFKKWLQSKGMPDLPFVSCYGSKVVGSSGGADELINSAGAVNVGTKVENGTQKIVFSQ